MTRILVVDDEEDLREILRFNLEAEGFEVETAASAEEVLSTFHFPLSTYIVEDDYKKIVPWCAEHTPQGGVVLLSPAAASYDAFKNFEHRGDFFREQILKLNQNEKN